jgi:hypothetical protein
MRSGSFQRQRLIMRGKSFSQYKNYICIETTNGDRVHNIGGYTSYMLTVLAVETCHPSRGFLPIFASLACKIALKSSHIRT